MTPSSPSSRSALRSLLPLVAALVLNAGAAAPGPFAPGEADVWILAGQSNMQGYGVITRHYEPDPRIVTFDLREEWRPALPPVHRIYGAVAPVFQRLVREFDPGLTAEGWARLEAEDRVKPIGGIGPEWSFARAVVAATGRPIVLVPCALGSTSLAHWSPEGLDQAGHSLYGNMIDRIRRVGGELKGVLWYQGESQTSRPETAESFTADFLRLVDAVRRDTGRPDLPFLYVQIGRFCIENRDTEPAWRRVQELQRLAARERPNLWVVPAVDLPLDDLIHIGEDGQHRLGRRLAEVALTHVYGRPGHGRPIDFVSYEILPSTGVLHHSLRLRFSGVTGRLQAQGRPDGFALEGDDLKRDGPMVYRVEPDPSDPAAVIVRHTKPITAPVRLTYGLGFDRHANLTDERDMAVPAFGPVVIAPGGG